MMNINIVPVKTATQKRDFINVAWLLHKKDPCWVPPLRHNVKMILDTKRHPFYQHAELNLWVAYKDNKPVGRIAGILNHQHNLFHNENIAFWGFFETEDCSKLAAALFSALECWAIEKKVAALRGPMNPSMNYECGMQISAFDTPPFLMMTQNPASYPKLVESLGHHKKIDMHAWLINTNIIKLHPRLQTIKQKLLNDSAIVLRQINMKNYYKEIIIFINIYNDAWKKNWGFVPMTNEEVYWMAKELKKIIVPELAYFITVKGEPAACAFCLPNINQVLHSIRNGKLFPTVFFKFLWYLKNSPKKHEGRIPLLGVKQKFRHLKLGALLYAKYGEVAAKLDMGNVECSWILETNKAMQFGLKQINAEKYKTYRVYEKQL